MTEQWQELKETIIEMRDNNGTGTQQEVCKFLANLMDVLEKQMQEPTDDYFRKKAGVVISQLRADRDRLEDELAKREQEPSGDLISRQAALDAFGLSEKTRKYGGDHSGYDTMMKYEIQDVLEDLPPVNPQEPCDKYIKEIDHLRKYISKLETQIVEQEPKTGHWIEVAKYSDGMHEIKCSECESHIFDRGHANSYVVKEKYKYCPNCGAKMVEPQESEDKE